MSPRDFLRWQSAAVTTGVYKIGYGPHLIARIAEAESHRWLGEAEGLKVSLAGARAKLTQMDQITDRRDQTVQLGVPTFTDAAARTNTNSTWRPHHP